MPYVSWNLQYRMTVFDFSFDRKDKRGIYKFPKPPCILWTEKIRAGRHHNMSPILCFRCKVLKVMSLFWCVIPDTFAQDARKGIQGWPYLGYEWADRVGLCLFLVIFSFFNKDWFCSFKRLGNERSSIWHLFIASLLCRLKCYCGV